jgi:hypothetical protein
MTSTRMSITLRGCLRSKPVAMFMMVSLCRRAGKLCLACSALGCMAIRSKSLESVFPSRPHGQIVNPPTPADENRERFVQKSSRLSPKQKPRDLQVSRRRPATRRACA